MPKIIIVGSINMDVVSQVKRHPLPGETVFGQALHYIPGGKGSNQAVAASRLNDSVWLVGKLGRDAFGDALTQFLQAERLHLDYLTYSQKHPTGVAIITVDKASENSIVVVSGSNYALDVTDIDQLPIEEGDVVVSVFEIPQPTIKALFERARALGATTVLNPAPATTFIEGLQELVDYLIVNETELGFFAGQSPATDNVTQIAEQARHLRTSPQQTLIITLGAHGVICLEGETLHHIEAIAVSAVDTTGAGDCFTGAFAVGLFEGMALVQALHFANTAAAISVQTLGASTSMPLRDAVDALL